MRNGRLIALAFTNFESANSWRLAELRDQPPGPDMYHDPRRQDMILFVEDKAYPRAEIRRTLASWLILQDEFVDHGNGISDNLVSNEAKLSRTRQGWRAKLPVRECVVD